MKQLTLQNEFKLWMTLLIIVPSLLIMLNYTFLEVKVARQEKLQLLSQRVEYQEKLIDYWIAERAINIRELSQTDAFRTLDEFQMKRELDLKQQYDNNFDSLSYVDRDGYFRMSTLGKEIQFPSAIGKPYYEAALMGKDYISDVVIGRNSGFPIINFSSPTYDNNGNFQGLILGSVRTTTLEKLLRSNQVGITGQINLVTREGAILTEQQNGVIDRDLIDDVRLITPRISDDAFRNIRLGETGTASWTDHMGIKVIGAYKYLPERGWTLIGSITESEILNPVYTQLEMMAAGTLLIIMLILSVAKLFTNRIKKPIEWLSEQSNLVAVENYKMVGLDNMPKKMPYELDKLCETFINMSHKIEDTVGLLKMRETELESKIIDIQAVNEELENEMKERERAERIALLGIIGTGIAHEIRQPLNAIKVASESILYWNKKGENLEMPRIIEDIKSISGQAERINQIVTHLRSSLNTGRKAQQIPVKVNEVIYNVVQILKSQIKMHNIRIVLTLTSEEVQVMIVPSALEQIVMNLLINSIQALSTSLEEKRIEIRTYVDKDIVLEVKDNGPGISDELIEKIFDPFFTTKEGDKGMGLGLSIVRLFVEAGQGSIRAERNLAGGATFYVQFPIYRGEIQTNIEYNPTLL